MYKKCHSNHMQLTPKGMKVTIKFNEDDTVIIYHLAKKYAYGCVEEFIRTMLMDALVTNDMISEVKQANEELKKGDVEDIKLEPVLEVGVEDAFCREVPR